MLKYGITILLGYLIGSLSSGVLLSRFVIKDDIRSHGSGNSGATNMLRVNGIKYGILTLLGDMLKGIISVLIGRFLIGGTLGGMIGTVSAVIGHNFPIFFGFKGGKGIATSFGSLLFVIPVQVLIAFAAFLLTVFLTRYVSLGSIIAAVVLPLAVLLTMPFNPAIFLLSLFLGLLAILRHYQNIIRLLHHQESKLSFHKKTDV